MTVRIGSGLDVHPFSSEPRPLLLAGHEVSATDGLAGHSDADVLAHAVTDALLGALALGDLGSFFGVDTPELAGADSMTLLASALAAVSDRGWRVGNVDATVVAQQPRLADHLPAVRAALAAGLLVEDDAVSVKATTTDRLGAIGRVEGIACWATVLVVER
ncbi:2-C-methyl-D-erythritol 2,4-cyclodiphosphate synthase [Salsipaludibacter albus]|uniref:2-C-methyl-D-erythritol 2,4-cyclodiphosphate synthase n=1 Tax=Salsipaludibacter albus TaxID=2849650 RepID=UPI001EE4D000|nr:2-C-methyl-D-erythritol 2,4-cyclodiphosphate synthase [Salsipaludibacter albus]MBY5160943.1 2-C-methyl-D-erythritol 2,4-cyclodiphosphate synthase [Salsipaludibacter albus]